MLGLGSLLLVEGSSSLYHRAWRNSRRDRKGKIAAQGLIDVRLLQDSERTRCVLLGFQEECHDRAAAETVPHNLGDRLLAGEGVLM